MSVARALLEVRLCEVCRAEVRAAPLAPGTVTCHTCSTTARQREQLSQSKRPAWERLVVQGISAASWERSCPGAREQVEFLQGASQSVPIPVLTS